jgi:hypothetical protein
MASFDPMDTGATRLRAPSVVSSTDQASSRPAASRIT